MRTKKNNLTFIIVLVLGLTLLTAASVAAASTDTGYEAFKKAVRQINHRESGSGIIEVRVTDNGEEIVSLKAEGIRSTHDENFSAEAVISDGTIDKVLELYGIDGDLYMVDAADGGYYKFLHDENMDDFHQENWEEDPAMTPVEEELLDYFVGDLKDNFNVSEEADGWTSLSFSMEDSEVPAGLNLMIKAAAAAEHRTEDRQEDAIDDLCFLDDFCFEGKPELVEDVALQAMDVNILLDEADTVNSLSLSVSMTGLDAEGLYHELTVSVEMQQVPSEEIPATIDVERYEWDIIEPEDKNRR